MILACLVRAYTVARDTRTVRKEHVNEDGSANKMPLFLAMFKRFAGSCASGKFSYTHDDLVADIASDERLRLWLMEHSHEFQMRRDPASPSEGASVVAAVTPQDEAEDVASTFEEQQPAPTAVLPQEDLAAEADHGSYDEAPAQREHPEPRVSIMQRVIRVDDPALGWKRYDSAQHWAERLRDCLGNTLYNYDVLPTEHGCWGFALFERRDRANERLFVTGDDVKPYLVRERRS